VEVSALAIADAWVCEPLVHGDHRGAFLEWFRHDVLLAATGRRFEVAQANHSVSQRGVVRGIHFADTPPGQAKIVYCVQGEALDVVVDLRVGSPTFGVSDAVLLNETERRVVVIGEGLGHAFCALRDGTSLAYLVSTAYRPEAEHTVSPLDPDLALRWPIPADAMTLSPRDQAAPSLAEAQASGLLPSFEACTAWYAHMSGSRRA
jgi:dTDP-4-dehydrorhamnose 3,5-epimerase